MSDPSVHGSARDIGIPRRGRFYGWWMVLAGTMVLFVSSGIGFYGHGVILEPLMVQHGWSKGSVSSAITLFFLTSGMMGMLIGGRMDRYGPRPLLVIGASIIGLGFVCLSRIHELWQLYAVYVSMAVGWSGSSLLAVNTLITNWFIRKRGLAMSLTMTGMSLGGIVLVPVSSYLIVHWGLRVTLPILGAMFWIFIIPTALFLIRQRPSDMGQFPDGEPMDPSGGIPEKNGETGFSNQFAVWSRAKAMGTAAFWAIVLAFLLAFTGQLAFLMHQISFLTRHLGATGAASAVSLTAAASITGRLILGAFVDRYEKRIVIKALCILQGLTLLLFAGFQHVAALYAGSVVFGLGMGCLLMSQSLILAECFGLVSFATVSGAAGLFIVSGSAFGPTIAGLIFDATQSYQSAFTIFAANSFLAAVAIHFARAPSRGG